MEGSTEVSTHEAVSRPRLSVARILMVLASVSAVVAAIGGVSTVLDAGPESAMVEAWRVYGFLVFAGLFALLAWRPLGYRWVWEIVIVNKILLAATAAVFVAGATGAEPVAGASAALIADGALAVVLVAAYVLCRGWTAGPRRASSQADRAQVGRPTTS